MEINSAGQDVGPAGIDRLVYTIDRGAGVKNISYYCILYHDRAAVDPTVRRKYLSVDNLC